MEHFGISNVSDIYALYTSRDFLNVLDFDDRKRFLSLVGQYTVSVRKRLIPRICGTVDSETRGILRTQDDNNYHLDTGFGHLLLGEEIDNYDEGLDATMSPSPDPSQFL